MSSMRLKHPADSVIVKTELVCPTDTNPLGVLKGGRLVEWMDMAAAGSAQIHSGKICVTAAISRVVFSEAAKNGDIIMIHSKITRVFNTSMEIYVRAFSQNIKDERKRMISEAYFTFVAIDNDGNTTKVTGIKPVSQTEKKQYKEAGKRRNQRF